MATNAPVRLVDQCVETAVPFFDWGALYGERSGEYLRIIDETASAGGFILQAAVDEFERKLAAYLGVKHAIGTSDCTNAMLLGFALAISCPALKSSSLVTPSSPRRRRFTSPAAFQCRSISTSETPG